MTTSAQRLRWSDLPAPVRSAIQDGLQAEVVRDETRSGGFSPGMTSVLWLSSGRQVFAKAISAVRDQRAPGLYRREITVMQSFSADVPAPSLLWSYDDGDWVVLVLDFVAGHMPSEPWAPADLDT